MKRIYFVLTILLISILFEACGLEGSEKSKIKIGWDYSNTVENDESYYSDIYLVLESKSEEKVLLGQFVVNGNELKNSKEYELYGVPKEAIIAYQSFYAGIGDILYVQCNDDKLCVYWKPISEDEADEAETKLIKEINIPANSVVEAIKN